MKKIIHIITGLGNGGAEHMLYKLIKYSDKTRFYHEVISLMDEGVYGCKINALGVKVHCLNINRSTGNIIFPLLKARHIAKKFDIVSTWLYHADIFGFIIAKVLLRKKLIWNIRHSNLDKNANKPTTLKIVRLNSFLSRAVNLITYNSNRALENHLGIGYSAQNAVVIPNGFELDKFQFNMEDRLRVREKLKLGEVKTIITVGRWDVQKDYYTLLKALNEVRKKTTSFKMIMVGANLDYANDELVALIEKYNLKDNIILLGIHNNIPALLAAADIYVSSSLGESFSNAIGEAMACELPCIVTDVGDSKLIVEDTGKVVNAGDYISMAEAMLTYLNANPLFRNFAGRQRIKKEFEISKIAAKFEGYFDSLI